MAKGFEILWVGIVFSDLFSSDVFQFFGGVHEVISICLWDHPPLVGLLHEVFVALFLREMDRVLFGLEIQMRSLQKVRGRFPSHQGILPSMALLKDIPIHPPMMSVPISRLCRGFCGAVYPGKASVNDTFGLCLEKLGITVLFGLVYGLEHQIKPRLR